MAQEAQVLNSKEWVMAEELEVKVEETVAQTETETTENKKVATQLTYCP